MSHIFISYKREDTALRDHVVEYLMRNGIDEEDIWFDQKSIPGGAEWHNEIIEALEEAFVILVIVTSQSLKSIYVTFEWSYGLAQGKDLLPLVFEGIDNIPAPLNNIQTEKCIVEIPSRVAWWLLEKKKVSNLTLFSAHSIFRQFLPLMISLRICLWMYEQLPDPFIPTRYVTISTLIGNKISNLLLEEMPEFWLRHSHAFTKKQKLRYQRFDNVCKQISSHIHKIGPIVREPTKEEKINTFNSLRNSLFELYETELPYGYGHLTNWTIIAQLFPISRDDKTISQDFNLGFAIPYRHNLSLMNQLLGLYFNEDELETILNIINMIEQNHH
jgi:hypothetical protein